MTLLPILERELRVRARRPAGHWTRFGIGLGAFLICLSQLTAPGPVSSGGAAGQRVFNGIVAGAFLLSCAACFLTAEALTAERREGTLGLLFLTRVNALDVLLGKFGSVGLTSLCGLLVLSPVLVVPILAGGVTGGEALRTGLALMVTLGLTLALGLWAATSREPTTIRKKAVWGLVVAILAPFCLWHVPGFKALGVLSPWIALVAAGDYSYRSSAGWYWGSLIGSSILTGVTLTLAALRLRRTTEPEAPAPAPAPVIQASKPAPRLSWRSVRTTMHPIAWLVRRQPGLRGRLWGAAGLTFLYQLTMFGMPGVFGFRTGVSYLAVPWLVVTALQNALITWAAGQFFFEGRRSAELEVLLTTPVGAGTAVTEQWNVLRELLKGPVVLMLVPSLFRLLPILMGSGGFPGSWSRGGIQLFYALTAALSALGIVLHVVALCWLGFWFGLHARTRAAALLWPVGLVMAGPYLFSSFLYAFLSQLLPRGLSSTYLWYQLTSCVLQTLFLLFDAGLIWWAWRRLKLLSIGPGSPSDTPLLATVASRLRRVRHWTPA